MLIQSTISFIRLKIKRYIESQPRLKLIQMKSERLLHLVFRSNQELKINKWNDSKILCSYLHLTSNDKVKIRYLFHSIEKWIFLMASIPVQLMKRKIRECDCENCHHFMCSEECFNIFWPFGQCIKIEIILSIYNHNYLTTS